MKKELFNMAWKIAKTTATNFATALKMAWKAMRLKMELKKGAVKFQFKKVDGSIRNAVGTLCADLFTYESKGNETQYNGTIKYFDLEANAFRSFKIENLL
jgi:hypothetical protein